MRIPHAHIIAVLTVAGTTLPAQTMTAYKTGERTTGQTKQCFYDRLGNECTRTISSIALCPLSIQVT